VLLEKQPSILYGNLMVNNAILGEIDELFLQGVCPMRVRKIPVLIGALLIALCGTGHALAQCNSGSVGFVSVGLVAGSPFQAERVTTMTLGEGGSAKTVEKAGNISRDRDGRIRSEQVTATYKVKRGDDIEKEVELKTILICDPVAQTLTQLDPLSKTAKVQRQQEKDGTTNTRNQSRNYCEIIFVFDDLEELGHRTIEGFDAEGKRRKYERSMNANGREIPEKTNDQWCAADLQAVVLQVVQDVGREVTELKNIQRVEPAPSLFEIPPDYTILEKTPLPSPKTPATNP
jgi:hypothetical protein